MLGNEGEGTSKTGVNCIVGRILIFTDIIDYVFGVDEKRKCGLTPLHKSSEAVETRGKAGKGGQQDVQTNDLQ